MSLKEMLNETGGKSAKFEQVGDSITGQVVATDVRQTKDYQTGELETWDDGNPKQQVVITLQTSERDPEDPEDTGERKVYIKWWGGQRKALQQAVRTSGADDILPGGTFTATYTGDGEQKQRGFNPPKLYSYSYQPPSATAGLLGAPETAAPEAAPAAAPAAPPADPQAAMAQVQTFVQAGLTDQQIAAGLNLSADAVAAVRAAMAAA